MQSEGWSALPKAILQQPAQTAIGSLWEGEEDSAQGVVRAGTCHLTSLDGKLGVCSTSVSRKVRMSGTQIMNSSDDLWGTN